jgi:hypothetical protein
MMNACPEPDPGGEWSMVNNVTSGSLTVNRKL